MPDRPSDGRIVIEWARVADAPPDDFDWRITPDPKGLFANSNSELPEATPAARMFVQFCGD